MKDAACAGAVGREQDGRARNALAIGDDGDVGAVSRDRRAHDELAVAELREERPGDDRERHVELHVRAV